MIKIGFFPAHPAQFWMMKALYDNAPSHVQIIWYIRDKDITKELIENFNIPYTLISKAGTGIVSNGLEMFFNILKFIKISKKDNINLWLSKYGSVNIAAWLTRIKNISFNDDDIDIVPLIAYTSYPFASSILCTAWTRMGKFERSCSRYNSFHELMYLHPSRFKASSSLTLKALGTKVLPSYVLIRLSSLKAHHDIKASGISKYLLLQIIQKLSCKYTIYISSEKPLEHELAQYHLNITANKMHHILAHASLVIADSQTMIAEAAVLGVPNLRISSFKGKLGYIDELESRGLSVSVHPNKETDVLKSIEHIISNETEKNKYEKRREQLINDTVDPLKVFWHEIEKTVPLGEPRQ